MYIAKTFKAGAVVVFNTSNDFVKAFGLTFMISPFSKTGLINSYDQLFFNSKRFLPTFDDGFKDHIFAAEILKKYNGIGIFFIPTSSKSTSKFF